MTTGTVLNRASRMKRKGLLREARDLLAGALAREPGGEAAHLVLAELQLHLGDPAGALETLERCLEEHPGSPPALRTLALTRLHLGEPRTALALLIRSLARDPGDTRSWTTLVDALAVLEELRPGDVDTLDPLVADCLVHEGVDPQELSGFLVRYLRNLPVVDGVLARLDRGESVDGCLKEAGPWAELDRPAVRAALGRVILTDLSVEALVAALRRAAAGVLSPEAAGRGGPVHRHLELLVALARNCHLTGFVHTRSEGEARQVESILEAMTDRPLGTDPLDAHRVALLASYVPLAEWDRTPEVLDAFSDGWAPELQPVLFDQVVFPARELEHRERIPVLNTTQDRTSERVQALYELHPTPRWTGLRHRSPVSLAEYLARVFPWREVPGADQVREPRILVAGCGTGRDALERAGLFARSTVVGVDLSLASLAFATRRALEAGVDAVRFIQGDILALEAWEEEFDLVEAVGVLHHMADPEAGWRILAGRVRPGGFMRVGVYTRKGRGPVERARAVAARSGWDRSHDGIRSIRTGLIRRMDGAAWGRALLGAREFYSLDEFRGMVLHPHEDPFTLPRLQEILSRLELEFLGFGNVPAAHRDGLVRESGGTGALSRLEAWIDYEAGNPGVFGDLYECWVRKPE